MRIALREVRRSEALVWFEASLPPRTQPSNLEYDTRVGALATLNGVTIGAFDREHRSVALAPSAQERILELRVEREALPTNGLPSGGGLRWRWLQYRSHPEPQRFVFVRDQNAKPDPVNGAHGNGARGIVLWGHSHLDVAWLWTYAQTERKAVRTFANALALLEEDSAFIFMQSQPQLYEFVAREDPELFERTRAFVREARFDADVAALWVEPDCNIPSGESLLRQMLFAHRFCMEEFGQQPSIAWLPDSFGFARTLPTLLAHAGIAYFATTKLQWNDTTRFPYPQFRWRGPDQSEIVGALIASYDGGPSAQRVETAVERDEPLVIGYGDGGGGPTLSHLSEGEKIGRWQRPRAWFKQLDARRDDLPVHDDELYLEFHRGVYTTHHAVKASNAELERALEHAEELVAWCMAVHAPAETIARLSMGMDDAWRIVLRNQFHDVLPGTSIRPVYRDVTQEYERARGLIDDVVTAARAILPRAPRHQHAEAAIAPIEANGEYVFDNGLLQARLSPSGALTELKGASGRNVVAQANLLASYRDVPKKWEAWNIDAGYEKRRLRIEPKGSSIVDDAVEIRFLIGTSPATMRARLVTGEPFLRVDLAVDWHERKTLLRLENWLTIETDRVTYGAPHGVVERSARSQSPADRARYEVPGQRFATAHDSSAGIALFALDTYGWNARALPNGGLHLGHSLLRSTTWPDPVADRGPAQLSWAFAPFADARFSVLERAWQCFASEPRVRLFTSDDDAIAVVACKPAADGDGVIVRIRECDGEHRTVAVRSGGRMRHVACVDGRECPIESDVRMEGERFVATIPAYGLRSFRVRF